MSVVEKLPFDDRVVIMSKSYESTVLILNFSDSQVINS